MFNLSSVIMPYYGYIPEIGPIWLQICQASRHNVLLNKDLIL
jgi:hypothetical protein